MKAAFLFFCGISSALAAPQPTAKLNEKLDQVRNQRIALEKALVDAESVKKNTEIQLKRLRMLQKLQLQEKSLTEQRLKTLESYLKELQTRKKELEHRLVRKKDSVRGKIAELIHPLLFQHDQMIRGDAGEAYVTLKEKILSSLSQSELKELESLLVDLRDAEDIETRIEQEKQQISSLMQDISEQESLIQFHQKIREEIQSGKREEHLKQLEEYQRLKVSEVEIEKMVSQFQERQKQEEKVEDEKKRLPLALRPKSLPWPLKGKVVSTYGQHRDQRSGLNIFKKGIEILTITERAPILAVLDGRVQYAGEIPGKGRIVIMEHANSIYTIYAGFSESFKSVGDEVKASEKLGFVEANHPLYFEIRSRNVAIDPVKWLQ